MTQPTDRHRAMAINIAREGFGDLWAELSPIGRRRFLEEIARTVRVLEEKISDAALRDSVLRALAAPDTWRKAER